MSAAENRPKSPDPYGQPLAASGMSAVFVPLIIGGALVAAALILWSTHRNNLRLAESAQVEEEARADLRKAYRELRSGHPEASLVLTDKVGEKIRRLAIIWPTDYSDLRAALLLIEAQAEFMIDGKNRAGPIEAKFEQALSLLDRASGEFWEQGMLGRARARLELKEYREAEEDLSLLLAGNPNFGTAYYWRAKAREGMGDAPGAAEDERRAKNLAAWPPFRD